MTKQSTEFKDGQKDGRTGAMQRSGNRDYIHGYYSGRQEYDYWYSRSAFEEDADSGNIRSYTGTEEFGFGSFLGCILIWVLIWGPIELFFGCESIVFNVIFWGGLVLLIILLFCLLANLFIDTEDSKQKHKK